MEGPPTYHVWQEEDGTWAESEAVFDLPPLATIRVRIEPDGPADTWNKIVSAPYGPTGAPLDPQQPTPEEMAYEIAVLRMQVDGWKSRYGAEHAIAESARLTVKEIETVLRGWPFPTISPLPQLRALYTLLAPPAPQWQAKEDEP